MFGLFKKKKDPFDELTSTMEYLKIMGYDPLIYGVGVAEAELLSGYSPAEVATHIAYTTMALDIKEAGSNIIKLYSFLPHAVALLNILKEYKDKNLIHPTQWEHDSNAIHKIMIVTEHQKEWIEKILSDPISGKERLAKSRINYNIEGAT